MFFRIKFLMNFSAWLFTIYPVYATQSIEDYVQQSIKSGAILIAKNNHIILDKAYGYANREKMIPNQVNTRFLIGSLTKQFTAAAIMKLAASGKLDMHDKVSSYLPSYQAKWANEITIHQLLSHTSGIPDYLESTNFMDFYKTAHSTTEVIHLIQNAPLRFVPGSQYEYSGSGYLLLGAIIEAITQTDYNQYLEKEFFQPFMMQATLAPHHDLLSTVQKKIPSPLLAAGYAVDDDGSIKKTADVNLSTAFAEASIISSTHDLYQWQKALYTAQIIPKEWLKKMLTDYGHSQGYGIFLNKDMVSNQTTYLHQGLINGYASFMIYNPTEAIQIIILSNLMSDNVDLYQFTKGLMKLL